MPENADSDRHDVPTEADECHPGNEPRVPTGTRAATENVEPIDPRTVLEGVCELEVLTWNHEHEDPSIRHMGPMAEAFDAEFGLGAERDRIAAVDAHGASFGAIQGLAGRLDSLAERLAVQRELVETQRGLIQDQRERLTECAARLDALEAELADESTTD